MMVSERRLMALKFAVGQGNIDCIIFILDKLKTLGFESLQKNSEMFIKEMIDFASSSDAMGEKQKPEVIKSLQDWYLKNYGGGMKESNRFFSFDKFLY